MGSSDNRPSLRNLYLCRTAVLALAPRCILQVLHDIAQRRICGYQVAETHPPSTVVSKDRT